MSNKTKAQRGRPQVYAIKFPGNKGTINTVQQANKVECRATVVARFKNWVKEGYLVASDQLVKEGKRGRYSTVYWKAGAWKAFLAMQKRNKDKSKKLDTVPAVDLTPAPEPVTA
jgi:hypothetical protein